MKRNNYVSVILLIMTILAHGLWAAAIYKPIKKSSLKKAVFWAIFPDLFWGIPFVPYLFFFNQPIPLDFNETVWWFFHLYGFSHSLIVGAIAILLVTLFLRRLPLEMLAWPFIHILPDIVGHTHFRTPFLYPLSYFSVTGPFSWTELSYRTFSHFLPLIFLLFFYLPKWSSK